MSSSPVSDPYDFGPVPEPAPVTRQGPESAPPSVVAPYAEPLYPPVQPHAYGVASYQAAQPYLPQPSPYQGQVYPYQGLYPTQLPEHPQSGTILTLGILGVFFGIFAPFAWGMGARASRDVAAGQPYRFGGSARAGMVLGITFTVLQVLFWGLLMFVFVAAR